MFWHGMKVFFLAMVPVIELRGAIPLGVGLGLSLWSSLGIAIVGNLVPVPFILLFIRSIFRWLRGKSERMERLVSRLENHAGKKGHRLYHSQIIGLLLLVAVPLPGTGAWTGALVAALFNLRLRVSLPTIAAGVAIAGVLTAIITYGISALV